MRLRKLRDEAGTATAETALMLMVVVLMVGLLLGVGAVGIKQLQLNEATRTVTREVMRGVDPASAIGSGQQVAGPDSSFTVSYQGEWVEVRGRAKAVIGAPGGLLSQSFDLHSSFSARIEPHLVGR